jgi:hypothetical protein
MAAPQQGVIACFTNEGEGMLGILCKSGFILTYTGDIVAGKAQGRGTVRCEAAFPWTLRDAEFRGGRMLPCRAVIAWDNGDAYAGPLAAGGLPPNGALAAVVRGDGGLFQGEWPAKANNCFCPHGGAAVVFPIGSVHPITLRGEAPISSAAGGSGWRPGGDGWGPAVGIMECPTAHEVPFTPLPRHAPHRAAVGGGDEPTERHPAAGGGGSRRRNCIRRPTVQYPAAGSGSCKTRRLQTSLTGCGGCCSWVAARFLF